MTFPVKKLRFGPYDFKIEGMPEGCEDYGDCCFNKQVIRLQDSFANRKQAAETTLHECIHALLYVSGYTSDDANEERLVTIFSLTLASFIRDNPKFWSWLISSLR